MSTSNPFSQCTRFLNGHGPRHPAAELQAALDALRDGEPADIYGKGELIESFEKETAQRLGMESAIFMPSGTMAQQIAMRIWSDKNDSKNIAMHATSHLEIHEEGAYRELHGLHAQHLADATRLLTIDDLQKLSLPVAAILWELPQREIGGQLPSWDALTAEVAWAKARGIACHLDGARLWEAAPEYDRPLHEIAGLFDSVYVSFYKGLGGIAGAVLAGPSDFIAESRPWLRRHGGNLISLYPYILSARAGLKKYLSRFGDYRDRAQSLAKALASLPKLTVVPQTPQTNMMHLHIDIDAEALNNANQALAVESKLRLFGRASSRGAGLSKIELSLGDACADIDNDEVTDLFRLLMESATNEGR